jgi:tRNA dimethylallyltransferase
MEPRSKNKMIVILGPTASGKSDLAIRLAQKFNGEIISADSRQIYRHANLTTGKITSSEQKMAKHWLIDILNINSTFSAEQFKKKAQKIIQDILKRQKLPIICGGTGFWIKALADNVDFPPVKPDWKLRAWLNKFSAEKLFLMLKKLDARRAKNIDAQNKVRLIRAIEICKAIGKVPKLDQKRSDLLWSQRLKEVGPLKFLQIGIKIDKEKLHQNIQKRLEKRFKQGMIREVENLHKKYGASWKRLESLGLEFRWIARFLQHKISRKEMEEKLFQEIKNYAKRQMTWFKRDEKILWLKDYKEIETATKKFLKI